MIKTIKEGKFAMLAFAQQKKRNQLESGNVLTT